jgi:hypothetical protein
VLTKLVYTNPDKRSLVSFPGILCTGTFYGDERLMKIATIMHAAQFIVVLA